MRTLPRFGFIASILSLGSVLGCSSPTDDAVGTSQAGLDVSSFCPSDLIPRKDMARFLMRLKRGRDFVPPSPRGYFRDVTNPTDQAWIEALYDEGITKGCGDQLFCPNDPVPREQMAAFIVRLFHGRDFSRGKSDRFDDVVDGHEVFEGYIEQLADDGITKGCSERSFCPSDLVPREQMAAFLMRAAHPGSADERGGGRFDDVPPENIFSGRIEEAVADGIMETCGGSGGGPSRRIEPSPAGVTTWVTPDIKSTLHIAYFNIVSACLDVGCSTGLQTALIEGLRESANPEPPASFDSASWQSWKDSREYRGYIHVNPVKFTCDELGQISVKEAAAEINDGYTKEPYPTVTVYSSSDVYQGPDFSRGTTVEPLDRGDCAIVWSSAASRVSENPRRAMYAAFLVDAPFVYERVAERICCDGSVTVSVEHSHFPTSRLYVDDTVVDVHEQRELGRFMYSGGGQFHANGSGIIAGASAAPMSWSGRSRSTDGS